MIPTEFKRVRHLQGDTQFEGLLRELNPKVDTVTLARRIRAATERNYFAIGAFESEIMLGVAGFRFIHTISWGRVVYVDDLVVASEARGRGIGGALLRRVEALAFRCGCEAIQLESGIQRERAHSFYRARGFENECLRFGKSCAL